MNIDCIMRELAEYIRMQEEAAAMVESLKDQLKERMTAAPPAASTGGSTPASSTAFRTALTIDAHGQPCYNRHERRCRP